MGLEPTNLLTASPLDPVRPGSVWFGDGWSGPMSDRWSCGLMRSRRGTLRCRPVDKSVDKGRQVPASTRRSARGDRYRVTRR